MEKHEIESVITAFASAVDNSDTDAAALYLHPAFRVTLSNFNEPDKALVLNKEQYLAMMSDGKVGGNQRNLSILLTDQHKDAAVVKADLDGAKMNFTNYYSLVKSGGVWLIINDIPQTVAKTQQ